ncbi:MAG: cytochrome C [Alcaligenaceae bacterium]|nr:MAG: cytochrome C [Alcaligenaceae bacterium]
MYKLAKTFSAICPAAYLNARKLVALVLFSAAAILCSASDSTAQSGSSNQFNGIGRTATTAEVKAWDIDVRPDLKGLPVGSGKVQDGQPIWESKCASCHGTFGESNEVFTPLVGGTTAADVKRGRVASLTDPKQPQRSTLMKVATISSLYDYIYRAMPWNAPRSLTADDTYAVLAYMLNLAEILPDDFELSNKNMADVQQLMPNRNGMTREHGLWRIGDAPDVKAVACLSNCVDTVKITSSLPDYVRNAHENLAEQNRAYGPFRGVDTTKPPLAKLPGSDLGQIATTTITSTTSAKNATPNTTNSMPAAAVMLPADLFKKQNCTACHATNGKLVGPSVTEMAAKYKGQANLEAKLIEKVLKGGAGVWGAIPMPAQSQLSLIDTSTLVKWILNVN